MADLPPSAKNAVAELDANGSRETRAAVLLLLAPQVQTLVSSGKSAVTALQTQEGAPSSAFKSTSSCQSLERD